MSDREWKEGKKKEMKEKTKRKMIQKNKKKVTLNYLQSILYTY